MIGFNDVLLIKKIVPRKKIYQNCKNQDRIAITIVLKNNIKYSSPAYDYSKQKRDIHYIKNT